MEENIMPYNEKLAEKIRDNLRAYPELTEKKMFGGLCFLLRGNMCCGIIADRLVLRINGPKYDELLKSKYTSIMDFGTRPTRGFLYVENDAINTKANLTQWLGYSIEYCLALPPK